MLCIILRKVAWNDAGGALFSWLHGILPSCTNCWWFRNPKHNHREWMFLKPCKWDKLHPPKLTWNLNITCLKRKIIFQTSIFRFHVSFLGCTNLNWVIQPDFWLPSIGNLRWFEVWSLTVPAMSWWPALKVVEGRCGPRESNFGRWWFFFGKISPNWLGAYHLTRRWLKNDF